MKEGDMKYAAFITRSQTIPGDERSRTNPGHGYPEHTVTSVVVLEFESKADMMKWVEQEEKRSSKLPYRLVEYREFRVRKSVTLEMMEDEDDE
jgi:hypothetical protein